MIMSVWVCMGYVLGGGILDADPDIVPIETLFFFALVWFIYIYVQNYNMNKYEYY